MSEYIDRDNLIKDLCTVSAPTPSESWIVEKCIEKVNEQRTANVVPKSEVEEISGKYEDLKLKYADLQKDKDELIAWGDDKKSEVEKALLDVEVMGAELSRYTENLMQMREQDKRNIAREIFEEIEKRSSMWSGARHINYKVFAELKKKYTEGKNEEK